MDTYRVEGIPYDDSATATVIAKRLFERFKKRRSVIIYAIDPSGTQRVHNTLSPISGIELDCPTKQRGTIDMFTGEV